MKVTRIILSTKLTRFPVTKTFHINKNLDVKIPVFSSLLEISDKLDVDDINMFEKTIMLKCGLELTCEEINTLYHKILQKQVSKDLFVSSHSIVYKKYPLSSYVSNINSVHEVFGYLKLENIVS